MECAYRAGQGVQRSLELSLSAAWIPICTGYSGDTLNAMFSVQSLPDPWCFAFPSRASHLLLKGALPLSCLL